MHINPMLNEKKERKKKTPRKVRSDKKADIRIPISESDYNFVLYHSRSKRMSMTAFCTDIVRSQLQRSTDIHEHPYVITDRMVHIKPEKDLYDAIVRLSVQWGSSSIREAAHRILTDSIFYIRGGIHIESFQRKESHLPGDQTERLF